MPDEPLKAVPELNTTSPDEPTEVASPDPMRAAPLDPEIVTPLLKTSDPEAPDWTAFPDATNTPPEVPFCVFPELRTTMPLFPTELDWPDTRVRLPVFSLAEPVNTDKAPLLPDADPAATPVPTTT